MGFSVEVTARGNLDCWRFDRSIEAEQAPADELYLNLSKLGFVDPYALVGLTCLVDAAAAFEVPVNLAEPHDASARTYLHRAGFGDVLDAAGVEHGLPDVNRHDTASRLMELCRFDAAAVDRLGTMIAKALVAQGVSEGIAGRVSSSIWEAGDNVHAHSQAVNGGVACAQLYKADTPDPYIVWAVGDAGIGVRASLERRYDVTDDAHALSKAIEPGTTSTADARGVGLGAIIRLMVEDQGATLFFRSGQARMIAVPNGNKVESVAPVQGTMLAGRIDCAGFIRDPGGWQWSN